MIIDMILTPAGRSRLAGGWAKLPKWVRSGLLATIVTAGLLLFGVGGGYVTWLLGSAGHVVLAVVAGCLTCGALVGGFIAALERSDS